MNRALLLPLAPLLVVAACARPAPEAANDAAVTSAGATEPMIDNRTAPDGAGTTAQAPAAMPSPTGSATALPKIANVAQSDYLGRWVGVEGLVLDVGRGSEAGSYRLAMQWSLDDKGVYTGYPSSDPAKPGIRFRRNGEDLVLRPTNGDATGLKWLAGKKTCLTVKQGEGYCRA